MTTTNINNTDDTIQQSTANYSLLESGGDRVIAAERPESAAKSPDVQNLAEAVKEGQAAELKVLEVDPIHHRIVLAATGWPKENGPPEAEKQANPG